MIQEGLLWFDDDPVRTVGDKVGRAVLRYQQKYGHKPDVCYVHPAHLSDNESNVAEVKVLPAKSVLPHHFWLGIESQSEPQARARAARSASSRTQRRR
jgi:hypothetical protein